MEPSGGEDMDVVGLRRDDDGKPCLDSEPSAPSSPPVWRAKGVLGGTAVSGVFGGFFFL